MLGPAVILDIGETRCLLRTPAASFKNKESAAPMHTVFLLWHSRPREDSLDEHDADDKLIGVYSSAAEADAARKRKLQFEGFRDYPDCFSVTEYVIDKDAWSEGFVTVTMVR